MSGRFYQTSSVDYVGDSRDPDIVYYNASIINNTTDDATSQNVAIVDPPIKFNETRDTAIIRDASKYQFSIVRFVVNGANKDLPLFIPQIQSGTGQTDVNLTEYAVGITYSGTDRNVVSFDNSQTTPGLTYVIYEPETKNTVLAPIPRTTASSAYVGVWNTTTIYQPGQIVYYTPNGLYYVCNPLFYPSGSNIPINPPIANQIPPSSPTYWSPTSSELGNPQDLSSRYYWVYTYSHWVDLVQNALESANLGCYNAWVASGGTGTYTSYNTAGSATSWVATNPTPVLSYNPNTNLFSIAYPPSYLSLADQTAVGYTAVATAPVMSLYFNVNMEGLLANFDNNYYNATTPFWRNAAGVVETRWAHPNATPSAETAYPLGFANEMVVKSINYGQNYLFKTPIVSAAITGQRAFILMTQDYLSNSTLWSPIESIVFTSALLPIQNESQAPPNALGAKNTGNSAATSQSAFAPIITDVALDLSSDPSGYRKMIYYAPSAEYRMSDFQNSKSDIRSIDIQVFWRNRLDNNLYPLSMFNLSSVSIKLMFRKKAILAKSERQGMF